MNDSTARLSLPVIEHRPAPIVRPPFDTGEKKEKCGVIGVWGDASAIHTCYLGTYAQQHRGQESAGIAATDGSRVDGQVGMGLIPDVFDSEKLKKLGERFQEPVKGAIGHNRYSTAGGSLECNAQPLIESFSKGEIAVAHNGNLINGQALRNQFSSAGHIFHTSSDTEVVIHLLASPEQQKQADPVAAMLRRLQGAFSLVLLFNDRIEAARDPWGWRPLVLGEMPDGSPIVASETVALDVVGARVIREVEPGEVVTLSDEGVTSRRFAEQAQQPAYCVFEHVYFANPSSDVFGQNVQVARELMGEKLAGEAPVDADYVMPMPDSGRSAANGYARASGIPYREGIVPNRYVGRTFIKPTQDERNAAVRLKLNVIGEIVRGKKLIVVDDSVVRGTTTKTKMQQLRNAGAEEIHLRISCPPIMHPCYFGVDFATREQLIAYRKGNVAAIRDFLGVDSLHYLSLDGLLEVMNRPGEHYCTACFSGDYRLDVEHPVTGEIVESGQERMFE